MIVVRNGEKTRQQYEEYRKSAFQVVETHFFYIGCIKEMASIFIFWRLPCSIFNYTYLSAQFFLTIPFLEGLFQMENYNRQS